VLIHLKNGIKKERITADQNTYKQILRSFNLLSKPQKEPFGSFCLSNSQSQQFKIIGFP
jgi:hypothetical protein